MTEFEAVPAVLMRKRQERAEPARGRREVRRQLKENWPPLVGEDRQPLVEELQVVDRILGQAFPVGDELQRLAGEDEAAPGLITPTPDRLCCGRAIEDIVQLHCVVPARSSNQDASHQELQDRFRKQTVCGRSRSPWESLKRSTKQRSSCAGFRHSVRPREARRSLKSTSRSSCRSPRPMSHRSRHNYQNGLRTRRIRRIE